MTVIPEVIGWTEALLAICQCGHTRVAHVHGTQPAAMMGSCWVGDCECDWFREPDDLPVAKVSNR